MQYQRSTGTWQLMQFDNGAWLPDTTDADGLPEFYKPLVLVADWMQGLETSRLQNAGFAEAAADTLFASLVQMDQQLEPSLLMSRLVLDDFVVGGQSAFDYYLSRRRASVQEDNTFDRAMQGDYAVPTLFNGNFDAIAFNAGSAQTIPGWSLSQNSLVDWREIGGLMERWDGQSNYLEKLGINPFSPGYQPNYTLQLNSGESVTRDRFVVPDWGALRFDLHVPNLGNGELQVTLQEDNGGSGGISTTIYLQSAVGTATQYLQDTRRIGYGTQGFETLTLDVPENLRGKVATLTFELVGSGTIYLDNVFFKSQHLFLGNPKLNAQQANVSTANNFLIEKSQYAVSYNSEKKVPNWVSWQLNNAWLGNSNRPGANDITADYHYGRFDYPWMPDATLPDGIPTSSPTDYAIEQDYDRGHLIPSEQRNRDRKDQIATFLTTNLLPQESITNRRGGAWRTFEEFTRDIVKKQGWELYTIAGGADSLEDIEGFVRPLKSFCGIEIPEMFWKVVVAVRPGQRLEDITVNTPVLAVQFPNYQVLSSDDPNVPDPTLWTNLTVRIKDIENLTGLDLLSNLPDDIERVLEEKDRYIGTDNPDLFPPAAPLFAPLLAEQALEEVNNLGTIGQSSVTENSPLNSWVLDSVRKVNLASTQINIGQVRSIKQWSSKQGSGQVSTSQISTIQRAVGQISIAQIGSTQVTAIQHPIRYDGVTQIGSTQVASVQSGTSQISTTQIGSTEVSSSQVGSKQNSVTQVNPWQFSFHQTTAVQPYSTEIPLPSSIPLQQFLSSHLFNLQNTSVPAWTNIFQGQTPFNLNFEIVDLPVGQLAEATIASYDSSGRPNSGTLTLDIDGNGLGWFIDSTPWDNTEFSTQPAATIYRATPGSPAFGRCDRLTTLLHELGHLQGLIAGNRAYDAHVRSHNGIPTFIGNDFSIPLTVDRSHTAIPTNLMSPYLSPGMRKLPSWENLQMLQAMTYQWNFGEGSDSHFGATVNHTFADNGTYTTTVSDSHGAAAAKPSPSKSITSLPLSDPEIALCLH